MTCFNTSKLVWDLSGIHTLKELERAEKDIQKYYIDTKQEEEKLEKDCDDFDKKTEPIIDLCNDVCKVTMPTAFMAALFNTFFALHRVPMSFMTFALITLAIAVFVFIFLSIKM